MKIAIYPYRVGTELLHILEEGIKGSGHFLVRNGADVVLAKAIPGNLRAMMTIGRLGAKIVFIWVKEPEKQITGELLMGEKVKKALKAPQNADEVGNWIKTHLEPLLKK